MKLIIYSSDLELTIRDCTNSLETNNLIVNIIYLGTNSQETMDCERTHSGKYHCTVRPFILFGFSCSMMLNEHLFGQIQTSQTGGQPYNDTSPYGECSIGTD